MLPNARKSVLIRLAKPALTRQVKVRVIDSDGHAAPHAYVGTTDDRTVRSDAAGMAELQLLIGAEYEIHAEAEVYGTGYRRITIGPTDTDVTVVLNRGIASVTP